MRALFTSFTLLILATVMTFGQSVVEVTDQGSHFNLKRGTTFDNNYPKNEYEPAFTNDNVWLRTVQTKQTILSSRPFDQWEIEGITYSTRDSMINALSAVIYVDTVLFIGVTGATGPTGATGATGPQGPTGATGPLTGEIAVACSDLTTALTTGTTKAYFRMPYAMTVTAVRAQVLTAPAGGTLTVDINESGVSILSTEITIDAGDKTSLDATVPAVISDSALADDAEITIDIVTADGTSAGLIVWIIGTRP